MTVLDLSAGAGLLAVMLTAANLCLGLKLAVPGARLRWPHPFPNLLALHNTTAYLLVATIAIDVLVLLRLSSPPWHWGDVLWPLRSPIQPLVNSLGALGLYLLLSVVATSYFRSRLGRRLWKAIHYLAYPAGVFVFSHGLLANPRLTTAPIDPLDGEKLLVEFCFGGAALAAVLAWRHRPVPLPRAGARD